MKLRVQRWCGQHCDVVLHIEQAAFYAMKAGSALTVDDVREILAGHRLGELPFSVEDLMKH